jgi:hypothetical protein
MKYPEIFNVSNLDLWKQKYLRKELLSQEWDLMVQEPLPDVFEIPVFTEEFCDKFIENVKDSKYHQSDRWGTPTDVLSVESIGLFDTTLHLVTDYFYQITNQYWRIEGRKWKGMNIDPQILKFKVGQDLRLHHDYCSITMSIKMDGNSKGGEMVFEKYGNIEPKQGHIYIYPGQITHRYGVRRIKNYDRYLLNIYCYAN